MQIDFGNITAEWMPFSDIVTPEPGVVYRIQNRGPDVLVLLEASSLPSADAEGGDLVHPYLQAIYEKGEQNLYLKALNNECSVNITAGE